MRFLVLLSILSVLFGVSQCNQKDQMDKCLKGPNVPKTKILHPDEYAANAITQMGSLLSRLAYKISSKLPKKAVKCTSEDHQKLISTEEYEISHSQ